MSGNIKALYRIALVSDTLSDDNTDSDKRLWLKANQNRLNQNFAVISNELERVMTRLDVLETALNQSVSE